MKILSSKAHGVVDYATVFVLASSPYIFKMSFGGDMFAWSLAFIHLILTLFTKFELGLFGVVPLWLHGLIELSVSIVLLVSTLWFRVWDDTGSSYFFTVFAIVLLCVWLISDYRMRAKRVKLM